MRQVRLAYDAVPSFELQAIQLTDNCFRPTPNLYRHGMVCAFLFAFLLPLQVYTSAELPIGSCSLAPREVRRRAVCAVLLASIGLSQPAMTLIASVGPAQSPLGPARSLSSALCLLCMHASYLFARRCGDGDGALGGSGMCGLVCTCLAPRP